MYSQNCKKLLVLNNFFILHYIAKRDKKRGVIPTINVEVIIKMYYKHI
jgi:hypothetical protein